MSDNITNPSKEESLKYQEENHLEYEVAKQIISLRKSLGLSQKELAEKLNTKQSAISRIEKGEQNISIGLLEKIAGVLGVEVKVSLDFISHSVSNKEINPTGQMNSEQPGGKTNPVGGTFENVNVSRNNKLY